MLVKLFDSSTTMHAAVLLFLRDDAERSGEKSLRVGELFVDDIRESEKRVGELTLE